MTTKNNPNEEIDLLELAVKFALFIKRNLLFFIIAGILGAGIGFTKAQLTIPYYDTYMIITSDADVEVVKELLLRLEEMKKGENTSVVAEQLEIPKAYAKKIRKFGIERISEGKDKLSNRIKISLQLKDSTLSPGLEEGFASYISRNNYIQQNINAEAELYRTRIAEVNKELQRIEENKANYKTHSNVLVVNEQKSLHQVRIELIEKKTDYQKRLELLSSFTIIQHFIMPNKSSVNWLYTSIYFGLGAALMAFFIALFRRLSRYLKSYSKQ